MKIFIKRFVPVVICFIFPGILISATLIKNGDILFWTKSHRLCFSDFKGRPSQEDTSLHVVSKISKTHTLGTISKSIDVRLVTDRNKTTFTIYAGMDTKKSWIKNFGDTISLRHE